MAHSGAHHRTNDIVMLTDACKDRKDWRFVVIRSRWC